MTAAPKGCASQLIGTNLTSQFIPMLHSLAQASHGIAFRRLVTCTFWSWGRGVWGGGGGMGLTPIYGLYRYVPRNRMVFWFSILN